MFDSRLGFPEPFGTQYTQFYYLVFTIFIRIIYVHYSIFVTGYIFRKKMPLENQAPQIHPVRGILQCCSSCGRVDVRIEGWSDGRVEKTA
jgi:hypothetical protein